MFYSLKTIIISFLICVPPIVMAATDTTKDAVIGHAPVITVSIDNKTPVAGDKITAKTTMTDPDGDTINNVGYQWAINGKVIAGEEAESFVIPLGTNPGDLASVTVRATTDVTKTEPSMSVVHGEVNVWGAWPPLKKKSGVLPIVGRYYTEAGGYLNRAESVESLLEGGNGTKIIMNANSESNDTLGGTYSYAGITTVFRYMDVCVKAPDKWSWPSLKPIDHVTLSVEQLEDPINHVRGGKVDLSYPCDKYMP